MGTLTTNLGLDKPTVGADADQWGTLLNQSLDTLDLSVQFGALTKSVAGGVNVTLTANEAAKQVIILTGLLTANIAVIVPNSPVRRYVIRNNTTGAFTVTVRRAVGTGVLVPQGGTRLVYNDGSEVFFEDVQFAQTAASATTATTATNVSGGTANVTSVTTQNINASGSVALNGAVAMNANVSLGDAGTDTTTVNSQVSAGGGVGVAGQVLASRGANLSPQWQAGITPTTGNAPYYGARAWVNFDGTRDVDGALSTANTNRLIRASANVASVLRTASGQYTVTFTTALPDANFVANVTCSTSAGNNATALGFANVNVANGNRIAPAAGSFSVGTTAGGVVSDVQDVLVNVIR